MEKPENDACNRCSSDDVSADQIINILYHPAGTHARWGKARIGRCLPLIDPKPCEQILDLACGFGTFTYLCAKNGAQVVGLDIAESYLRTAHRACSQFNVSGATAFVLGDVSKLPFADNSFDKLISIDGFEHFQWQDKRALAAEAARVLKPGGKFIIYTPNLLTKALKVLRLNLINLALGRIDRVTSVREYLAVKEPGHFGMVSPFRLRRLFRADRFRLAFRYSVAGGKKKRTALRILAREKIPLLRDLLNGRIALIAQRVR